MSQQGHRAMMILGAGILMQMLVEGGNDGEGLEEQEQRQADKRACPAENRFSS